MTWLDLASISSHEGEDETYADTRIMNDSSGVKGAMRFGTFKSIDFKQNWYVEVPVVPSSLML